VTRTRVRIAEGIYSDQYGLSAVVKLGRRQREKRFPFGSDLETLESWRIQTRAELDDEPGQTRTITGTLRADADKFIASKLGAPAYKSDRAHLRAWYPSLGDTLRSEITREHITPIIAKWRSNEVAARTIRHRARVLRELYRALDGQDAKTPIDHLKLPKVPAPQPVAVPLATMRKVATRLKKSGLTKDYARFLVRATTGQRPSQIMRTTADDLDLTRKLWFVPAAKGGNQIPMHLNDEMLRAWKVFVKANAWGSFDTTRAARVLRDHGWPKDIKPYALRATFAIDLLLDGADIGDVQGLLGHRQIQTTRSHYGPVLASRLRKVTATRKLKLA